MSIKTEIKDILLENFSYVYCDTCKNQETISCDGCHRKYSYWSLSPEIANQLAEKILAVSIVEEVEYEHCSAFHIENNLPRCWGTQERDICDCNGDKNKCTFYHL